MLATRVPSGLYFVFLFPLPQLKSRPVNLHRLDLPATSTDPAFANPPVVEIFVKIVIWIRPREIHAPVAQEHGLGSSGRGGTQARQRKGQEEVYCAHHRSWDPGGKRFRRIFCAVSISIVGKVLADCRLHPYRRGTRFSIRTHAPSTSPRDDWFDALDSV